MVITFIGQTTQSTAANATTTLNVAKPSGTTTGDLMLTVIAMTTATNDSGANFSAPSGWTFGGTGIDYTNTQTGIRVSVYGRVATANEPASNVWTAPAVSGRIAATTLTYRGADGIPAGKFVTTLQTDKSTTRATGSVTTDGNSYLVTIAADRFGSQTFTMPDTVRATVSTTNTSYAISDTNGNVPAGTYTKTAVAKNADFVGVQILFALHAAVTGNTGPTVSAGSAQTVATGSTVSLTGAASDRDGTIASVLWAQVSGPANVTLNNANSYTATTTISTAGTYVFSFSATDNSGLSSTANTTITVSGGSVSSPNAVGLVSGGAYYLIDATTSTPSAGGSLSYAISPSTNAVAFGAGRWLVPPLSASISYSVTVSESGVSGTSTAVVIVPGAYASGGNTSDSVPSGVRTMVYLNGAWT